MTNETGATLAKYTPVRIATDGSYRKINVSIEDYVLNEVVFK